MSDHSTPARTKVQWLKEIVSRLGQQAAGAEIREQAYREGYGVVNAALLAYVRNQLWPDRPKRGGGLRADSQRRTPAPGTMAASVPCPECGHAWTSRKGHSRLLNGLYRVRRRCQQCRAAFTKDEAEVPDPQRQRVERAASQAATSKTCTKCNRCLPVDCFGRKGDTSLFRPYCRECSNQMRSAHGLRQRLAGYALTVEQYEAMIEQQGGRCAICRSEDKGHSRYQLWAIDHCHTTGRVRGLLCNRCNTAIGLFKDNPAHLAAAVEYLAQRSEP